MVAHKTYSTSQLAEAAAVGPQTLRYYERRGLLPEPPRTTGGHRIYGPEHLERLLFIQRAQGLGFHLQEIRGMLNMRHREEEAPEAVVDAADRLLAEIESKMEALQEMRRAAMLMRGGDGDGPRGPATEASGVDALVGGPA